MTGDGALDKFHHAAMVGGKQMAKEGI